MKKSDRDIEQAVEDWLDAEARPMPQHVLESSLEAVARTRQAGRRPRIGPGWLSPRLLAAGAVAAVLVIAVLAVPTIIANFGDLFGPGPGAQPSETPVVAQVWDPAADFRASPNEENPSADRYGNPGVWSYLRSAGSAHIPERYTLIPNFEVVASNVDQWWAPCPEGSACGDPYMWIRHSRGGPNLEMNPGAVGFGPAQRANAVLAWTSPISGTVVLRGTMQMPQNPCPAPADGVMFTISVGTNEIFRRDVAVGSASGFESSVEVAAGDIVYVVVDSKGNVNCDIVWLLLAIESAGR